MAIAATQRFTVDAAEASAYQANLAFYGVAIAALDDAIAAIEADDIRARCMAVRAATEAVTTLYLNLDVKRGGELVDDLADLYGYILGRLLRVNLYNDPRIAAQVIDLLEPLRDGTAGRAGFAGLPAPPIAGSEAAERFGLESGAPAGVSPAPRRTRRAE